MHLLVGSEPTNLILCRAMQESARHLSGLAIDRSYRISSNTLFKLDRSWLSVHLVQLKATPRLWELDPQSSCRYEY